MALQTKILTADGSKAHHKFTLTVNEDSTNIATNTSSVSWSFTIEPLVKGFDWESKSGKVQYAVVINGVTYNGSIVEYDGNSTVTIRSGAETVTHDADGSKTLSYSFSITDSTGWSFAPGAASIADTMALTAIPRGATLLSAPDFTDQEDPTITYSNPAGNAVSQLDACISFTGALDDISYRPIDKTGDSYQFPLTEEERAVLRSNTTGPSRTVIFFVRTIIGDVVYYSTIYKTLYIAESEATRPEVAISATLNNGTLPSSFDGMYIQGKSRVDLWLSAVGRYGARVNGFSATVEGKSYGFDVYTSEVASSTNTITTDVIQNSGDVWITGYATDSRSITGQASVRCPVIAYSKPMIIPLSSENAIQCYRSDGNGNRIGNSTSLWIKAKRFYYDVEGKNTCALQWRWKPATEQWDDSKHSWSDLLPKSDTVTHEYNAPVAGEFDLKNSYTVQVRAIDDIGEADIKIFDIPTQDVALHLGKGGKNVSIGTYCDYSEERTFYSDWKAIFDKEVYIGGVQLDYIVEQGTYGIWTYKKWNSGKCEMYGRSTYWASVHFQINGVHRSDELIIDLPFTVYDCHAWVDCVHPNAWASHGWHNYDTNVVSFVIWHGQSCAETWVTEWYVVGNWK